MIKLYSLDNLSKSLEPTLNSVIQTCQYVFGKTTKATPILYQFSPPIFSFISNQGQREGLEKFIDIQNVFLKTESEACNFLNSNFICSQLLNLLSVTYPGLALLQKFEDSMVSFNNVNGKIFCEVTIKQAVIKYAGINSDPFKLVVNIQWLENGFLLDKSPTTSLDIEKEKIFLSEKDKKEEIEQALLHNRLSDDKKLSIHILLLNKFFEIRKLFIASNDFEKEILVWIENLENHQTKKILALPFNSLQINYDIADILCKFLNNKKNRQKEESSIARILLVLIKEESYFEKRYVFGLFKSEITSNEKYKLNTFINGLKKYIESNYSCKALFLLFRFYSELSEAIFLSQNLETMQKSIAELFCLQSPRDIYIELIKLLLDSENEPEKKYLKDFFDKSNYISFSGERLLDILLTIYLYEITLSSKIIPFFKAVYLNALGLNIDEENQLQMISIDPVYSDLLFDLPGEKEKKNKKIKSGILGEKRELYTHYKKLINSDGGINADKKIKLLYLFRKLILNRNIVFSVISNAEDKTYFTSNDNCKAFLNDSIFNSTSTPNLPDSSQPSEVVSESVDPKGNSNLNFNDNQEGISIVASARGLEYGDLNSSGYQGSDSSELGLIIDLGSEEFRVANFVYKQAVDSHVSIQNSSVCSLKPKSSIYSASIARSTFLTDKKTLKQGGVLEREQLVELSERSITAEQGITAIPLPDTVSYYREKYSVEAKYILDRSLYTTVSSGISPDYNYSPEKFFSYLNDTVLNASASNEAKDLLKLFFVKFQSINKKLIQFLECCMRQRHCLIEAIDYYNKFYYFERSRSGNSKAFPSEKKLVELGINKIVKNIFLLEFELFYNVSTQNNFEILQVGFNNSLNYLSLESSANQLPVNEIELKKTDVLYASFIDLDFQYFLTTNFLKIKKEIHFLESHVNTFIYKPRGFFSKLKRSIFFGENLLANLKKSIYCSQTEGSYEQRTIKLINKLKKLSWLKLFFIGIFFWSMRSKARIFEKIEKRLIASLYREKLNQIKVLKMSLEQSLNSFNVGAHDLIENQTIADDFVKFVSIVDSLVAYPIPQHLDMPSFVEMEGLTHTERTQLIKTVKLFTRPMSFYWEKCILPGQEEKINKRIRDSERQQNIILEKIEKLRQDFHNAINLSKKNTIFFQLGSKSNRFRHQEISKLVPQENFSRKYP